MSNILKVSTPVSGYENTINKQNQNAQESLAVKNPVLPDKVTRLDGRTDSAGEQDVRNGLLYDSNFGSFLFALRDIPKLSEVMSKMMFTKMATVAEAGIGKGTAAEIEELFQMLEMSDAKLKEFLKSQVGASNRLKGPLFNMLREAMDESPTVEQRTAILAFLKRYNDMSSGKHLLQNIMGNLDEIKKYMFRSNREELELLMARMREYRIQNNAENARILKEEIIPYLGKYVSQTRDMGKLRDLISLLTFNTARYENGNLDNVMESFRRLMDFPSFQKKFHGMDMEEFRNMLTTVDFDRAAGKEEWSDRLLDIIQSGVRGQAGSENKEAFLNVMKSILVNESVYMPVLHVTLPMILNQIPVFSEMWIDPDAERNEGEGGKERGVKLLLKFDMKGVGFFDIMMYYEKEKMSMLVHYPDSLAEHENEIRSGIQDIMKRNGIGMEYLAVEEGKEPISISAAFPKIYERRNTINVTI